MADYFHANSIHSGNIHFNFRKKTRTVLSKKKPTRGEAQWILDNKKK